MSTRCLDDQQVARRSRIIGFPTHLTAEDVVFTNIHNTTMP